MAAKAQLKIDIVSDVVCPWCIIGYKQLEQALTEMADVVEADLVWHPFELAPDTPAEGQLMTDYVRERYGASAEQSAKNRDRITQAGAPLGIDFRFSAESRIYSTWKAHQLLSWAQGSGKQTDLKMALFHAYFTAQRNLADDAVLLDAVEEAGLDRAEAAGVLEDQRLARDVRAEVAYWQDHNVTGVPAYIINGKFMIPGAQDSATFRQVIERVVAKEAELAG